MSNIQMYLRCAKKFKLRAVEGWEDYAPEKQVLIDGTAFHAYMEYAAKKQMGVVQEGVNWATPMGEIARGYLEHQLLPENLMSADEAHYIQLSPDVRLRCTFDLVYSGGGMLVIRDYKTFEKAPTYDIDLDFQARMYLWVAQQLWPNFRIYTFEHEYIRRTLPNVPKDKAGNCWTVDDCYKHHEMILSPEDLEQDGWEIQEVVQEIVAKLANPKRRWFRINLKGGGYDQCSSCSVKALCKADKQGNLNGIRDYEALAVKKETIYDVV